MKPIRLLRHVGVAAVALTLSSALLADSQPGHVQSPTSPSAEPPHDISSADWAGIREAYEAHRHAIFAVPGGHQAHNPGQRWLTHFDGRGFTARSDAAGWEWGLELVRYGFAGEERVVTEPARVDAAGQRVTYAWDAALDEWFLNDSRGLEHGFTLRARPAQAEEGAPLVLTLAVRGGLRAEVEASQRGVRFVDGEGAAVVTYSQLAVFDADGKALSARFESLGAELLLAIDERGARYPLTIDPIAQQAYLKASNTGELDQFGETVAVSGDTVVVGAPGERSNATGVNGDQSNNDYNDAGAAYVFVRSGATWSQQAYLKASNTNAGDRFGTAVAVSGDTVVVGAQGESSNATGVDGDQSDNSATTSGAAYVFVRSGTSWNQQAYLKASNTGGGTPSRTGDQFGWSVALSGDTIAVGAPFEDSDATGVDGDQSDNSADESGASYVFARNGSTWSQEAYLKASNTGVNDVFGLSISASDDTVVVGATGESSSATGVNGNQSDNSSSNSGAAYVFARSGTSWSQEAYLKASNTGPLDFFGFSISVSDDTVLVGAPLEDSNATGVNGPQLNNNMPNSGAAYAFIRSGMSWSQQAYLKASNTGQSDEFGVSVAISAGTAVIGAFRERSDSTGVDGDQNNDNAEQAGAAYLFVRSGTNWSQYAYLKASNTEFLDRFGWSVAVSADTVLVGAVGEDSSATGVNGDQSSNGTIESGAVYVFLIEPGPGQPYCFGDGSGTACPCSNPAGPGEGCANSTGFGGVLATEGSADTAADDLTFHASNLLPNQPALLFAGLDAVNGGNGITFGDGLRCAGNNVVRLGVRIPDAIGQCTWGPGLGATGGWVAGDVRRFQGWYRNPSGGPCGTGFNLTNGMEVAFL